jgi:hypothetical protein
MRSGGRRRRIIIKCSEVAMETEMMDMREDEIELVCAREGDTK